MHQFLLSRFVLCSFMDEAPAEPVSRHIQKDRQRFRALLDLPVKGCHAINISLRDPHQTRQMLMQPIAIDEIYTPAVAEPRCSARDQWRPSLAKVAALFDVLHSLRPGHVGSRCRASAVM